MDKDKIMSALEGVKSAISQLESACSSMGYEGEEEEGEESEEQVDDQPSPNSDKKSMIIAMMKKKLGK